MYMHIGNLYMHICTLLQYCRGLQKSFMQNKWVKQVGHLSLWKEKKGKAGMGLKYCGVFVI